MMLAILVSAGWSWLLSPCGVGVGAGGAGVAAGGGAAAGAPPRNVTLRSGCGWILYEYTYVCYWILPSAKLARS